MTSSDEKNMTSELKARQDFSHQAAASNLEDEVKPDLASRRTFTSNTLVIDDEPTEEMIEQPVTVKNKPYLSGVITKLAKWSLIGLLSIAILQLILTLVSAWNESLWLFGLYAGVTLLISVWIGIFCWREFSLLRRLKRMQTKQNIVANTPLVAHQWEASQFLAELCDSLPNKADINYFYELVSDEHSVTEQWLLFEDLVLTKLDNQAKSIVRQYSTEAGLLLAASPLVALDMALILWRNQKMLTAIAHCYGVELGYVSRIRLIRSIVTNLLYAGVSEASIELGNQLLSLEMAGKLSNRLAQGVGGGMLTARLGRQAMVQCRPVAFSNNKKPKLRKIQTELVKDLLGVFKIKP